MYDRNPILCLVKGLRTKIQQEQTKHSEMVENYAYELCVFTFGNGREKYQQHCDALQVRLVAPPLAGMNTDEEVQVATGTNIPFPQIADAWEPALTQALDAYQPDMIVSDMMTLNPTEYARNSTRKILSVINVPGPATTISLFVRPIDYHLPVVVAGGVCLSIKQLDMFGVLQFFNVSNLGTMAQRVRHNLFGTSTHTPSKTTTPLILVDSFWGLEAPPSSSSTMFLPRNVIPVGPITMPSSNANRKETDAHIDTILATQHPELYHFVVAAKQRQAHRNNKLLYVTTGSIVGMEPWLVQLLYRAFQQLILQHNCSIVWSLKANQQKYLVEDSNSTTKTKTKTNLYLSAWVPQAHLLQSSKYVDGVMTHCGWNGVCECVSGGKPIITIPFFADQFQNAQLLLDQGCATSVVYPLPPFTIDSSGKSTYHNDGKGITLQSIVRGCEKILGCVDDTNNKDTTEACVNTYVLAAKKLQALAHGPNLGCDVACEYILHAAHHGVEHLSCTSGSSNKKNQNSLVLQVTGHRPFIITVVLGVLLGGILYCAMLGYLHFAKKHTDSMIEILRRSIQAAATNVEQEDL